MEGMFILPGPTCEMPLMGQIPPSASKCHSSSVFWGPFSVMSFSSSVVNGIFCFPGSLFALLTRLSVVSDLHFPQFLYYNEPSVSCLGGNLCLLSGPHSLVCAASLSSSIQEDQHLCDSLPSLTVCHYQLQLSGNQLRKKNQSQKLSKITCDPSGISF